MDKFSQGASIQGKALMKLRVIFTFFVLILANAFGEETTPRTSKYLDSLLSTQSFDEIDEHLEKGDLDSLTIKKYENLVTEIKYISEYSTNELQRISQSGLLYKPVFTPFQASSDASEYFDKFTNFHYEEDYSQSVLMLKIAKSHKGTFQDWLYEDIKGKLELAQSCFDTGKYYAAYEILKPIENQVYKIEKLYDFREVYAIRLDRCKEIVTKRERNKFLNDTGFNHDDDYEISSYVGVLIMSQVFSQPKARILRHSSRSALETTAYLSNFKASGGGIYGIELSRYIWQKFYLNLRIGKGYTFYRGYNESTDLFTDIEAAHDMLAIGLRYNFFNQGRMNYYTSVHVSKSQSKSKRVDYPNLHLYTSDHYYMPSIEASDDQMEVNLGAILYPSGTLPLVVQARFAYVLTFEDYSYFGPQQLITTFSMGMYF